MLEKLQNEGTNIVDLSLSNPSQADLALDLDRVVKASLLSSASYTPDALGLLRARTALASFWSAQTAQPLDAKQICLAASTSELYAHLMKILCSPGDEWLVPAPSYPLLEQLAQSEGIVLKRYPLIWDGQWHIDFPMLKSLISTKSKAIAVVNPNNPTGNYVSRSEILGLYELGLPIVCDEVFLPYALSDNSKNQQSILNAARSTMPLVFVLGGLSKFAALPQLKCSWLIARGPQSELEECLHRLTCLSDLFLSTHQAVQEQLPELLRYGHRVQAIITSRLQANLSYAKRLLNNAHSPISLRLPQGGWYLSLQLPAIKSDEQWTLELLQEQHTHVLPGYLFDYHEEAMLVLSLLCTPENFSQGLQRIVNSVNQTC
ncbi:MAG: pyridoxal phosphate-dependent aminotransferase [Myxococcales bacterium]|nr:MAG: pyridoxal phosphate-dependent aminotransferase [Myxococcales bacterium]